MSARWRGDKHKLILEAPCARRLRETEWERHTGSLIIIEGLKGFNDKNNWKRKRSNKQNKIRGRLAKPLLMEHSKVPRALVETLEVDVERQRNEMHSEICIDKQQQQNTGQLGRQWFLVGEAPRTITWFSDFQFSTLLEVHSICRR